MHWFCFSAESQQSDCCCVGVWKAYHWKPAPVCDCYTALCFILKSLVTFYVAAARNLLPKRMGHGCVVAAPRLRCGTAASSSSVYITPAALRHRALHTSWVCTTSPDSAIIPPRDPIVYFASVEEHLYVRHLRDKYTQLCSFSITFHNMSPLILYVD